MAETRAVEVRRGAYHDSVTLMRVSRAMADTDGVLAALAAMATPLNLDLLAGMGFDRPDAGPADLVVAVHGRDDAAVAAAHAALESALAELSRPAAAGSGSEPAPRGLRTALRRQPEASVALLSVPGPHAFPEAMDALATGLHVMVFSDNVGLAEEVALKRAAAERGLLVMGPDCGTALVGGVGLGFANVVRPGPVGIVAASGTGAQQVMCLLDAAGVGVSHCLGVGGRDLSDPVGGRSTLQALAGLAADPATEVVMVVSKPPAPAVAERVRAAAAGLGKPVVLALLGRGHPDLTSATAAVLEAVGAAVPEWPERRPAAAASPASPAPPAPPASLAPLAPPAGPAPPAGALRGLFSGGTLCDEAMVLAAERLGPVRSNIPLEPDWALPEDLSGQGHLMIDFGDDRLTVGRPHPMVDNTLRRDRLVRELADPSVSVALLDVVLGHGAHPDPAGELAPAVAAGRRARDVAVVVSLCGTAADPQGWSAQAETLAAAGAEVFLSNAAAARRAAALAAGADR